ncbi:TIGR04255 family protein [Methanosarcina mazei]|uniref:TIGR04255 family protein n=1 Tax=Methanosarcina mazei TaxID=2209 RepID=A0A0F8LGU3_METMZ|nr:TIGR04255 family protein [Methanosarcina mazei]KKG92435.1 hypothetical protein DU66_10585 [Methanosarcina mazei]KKG95447.1 hypothetical protein DU69_06305 [Methanosarcina mazei]KKG95822.1 hypothetical protein DU68_16325 [Methanosarcina mazei]KKH04019.1 hypothetical protein DU56_15980 [Methanosarcina mazei]
MNTKYKKNYLTVVIARIDFSSRLNTDELPKDLRQTILKICPISEPKKIINQEFKFDQNEKVEVKADVYGTEWNFHANMKEKQFVISPNFLSISYHKYESFEKLKSEFLPVVEKLFEAYPDIEIVRLGLRYVNEINLFEQNPLSWEKYLNSNLLSMFEIPDNKEAILRGFSELIFNTEDMNLVFKYGMHNPDFPASIKKKIFILDFDAQYICLQELKDIQLNLITAHDEIEKLFEKSITSELRVKLNE